MALLRRGADDLKNGLVLGAIIGLLIADSSTLWIQTIVTTITELMPMSIQDAVSMKWLPYVVFGVLGSLIGYFVDRK